MDKQHTARTLLSHALSLVPFEGWTARALARAAQEAGLTEAEMMRSFPGGVVDALNFWIEEADCSMAESAQALPLQEMKIRERIAQLVLLRLGHYAPHREAVRKALAMYALPWNMRHSLRTLYRTVDAIWHLAGDRSTDFNWYTKRMLLAGVYSSTLLYWLDDNSEKQKNTAAFLRRRIEDVMRIGKLMPKSSLRPRL